MKFNKVGKNKQGYPEVSGIYVVVYNGTYGVSCVPYSVQHRAFNCYDYEDKPSYEVTGIIGWYLKEAFLKEIGIEIDEEYAEDDAL